MPAASGLAPPSFLSLCPQSPDESCDLLGDIQTCIMKSLREKARRKRSKATGGSLLWKRQGDMGT